MSNQGVTYFCFTFGTASFLVFSLTNLLMLYLLKQNCLLGWLDSTKQVNMLLFLTKAKLLTCLDPAALLG